MTVKFKINDKLKELFEKENISTYAPAYSGESAALDLYSTKTMMINSYEMSQLIPTGLFVSIPENHVGLIVERGSITKTPLKVRAGCIDAGYKGEVFVNLVAYDQANCFRTNKIQITEGEKLPVQLIVMPVDNKFEQVSDEEYEEIMKNSKRGDGKLGSSNK